MKRGRVPDSLSRIDAQRVSPERAEDLLDSWKEIAAHLKRDVSTVQRWEKHERLPIHRHVHDKLGSVYGFRSELDAWSKTRADVTVPADSPSDVEVA
jgi:hypothetical protein